MAHTRKKKKGMFYNRVGWPRATLMFKVMVVTGSYERLREVTSGQGRGSLKASI